MADLSQVTSTVDESKIVINQPHQSTIDALTPSTESQG